jgi:hypothetical protein
MNGNNQLYGFHLSSARHLISDGGMSSLENMDNHPGEAIETARDPECIFAMPRHIK